MAKSTWGKYSSAYNTFSCFEAYSCISFPWPLSRESIRAFAVWCSAARGLQPSTTRAYVSGLRFLHTLRGFPTTDFLADPVLQTILRGAARSRAISNPPSSTRRVVTFPLLLTLGTRVAQSDWDPISKQVLWSACTTAFFSSARLAELLASEEKNHDASSDLTWADVKSTGPNSILLRFKSGEPEGEFVDLFSFPGYNCCPILALRNLWAKQHSVGQAYVALPVFRFPNGTNLTTAALTKS